MKNSIATALTVALVGCAAPSTVVRTVDSRPSLAVINAPPGAILQVDGKDVGMAATYSGQPNVLMLEPGTHQIVVRDATGQDVFRQRVFMESELKTISVR